MQFGWQNLRYKLWSWADDFSLFRIDCLTSLARQSLPPGFWGDEAGSERGPEKIYLTFDDGPDPHTTPWLLELLEKECVPATFFLIGSHVARHEHLVEKIASAGHVVGNHSYSHPFMPLLAAEALEKEIDRTNALLSDIVGHSPELFRPPYGMIDRRGADCLGERDMRAVYWGAVPEDWSGPGAERVVSRVMRRLRRGTLVVLHEHRLFRMQTLTAAKQIICQGKELGYAFAPVG